MAPNEMALYPNWLILYVFRIIIPMLILVIVALKILIKSGRDIQREFDVDLTPSTWQALTYLSNFIYNFYPISDHNSIYNG